MILDSCFFVDLMGQDAAAVAKLDELVTDGRPISVSTVSVTEVARGLTDAQQVEFETYLDDVDVVPYDGGAARRGASILQSLDERGEPVGVIDTMVAATALERDAVVVTRNVSEFDRIDGLQVVPY